MDKPKGYKFLPFCRVRHGTTDSNRPFKGQDHVTKSIIKTGVSKQWLPEMQRAL